MTRPYMRHEEKKVGDIVNGWKIVDIFFKKKKKYAKVESTICDKKGQYRLTVLNSGKVGWPDRRRPDVSEKNKRHGLFHHKLYSTWIGMKNRCCYPSQPNYKNYGGRGITVCEEWQDITIFHKWCMENGWDDDLTLNRIDNDGDYCPNNCEFVTRKENSDNRRNSLMLTAWGEIKNASDWALDDRCQATYASICYRVNAGWDHEEAISTSSWGDKDNFRRHKELYKYVKDNHPDILTEFLDK